MITSDGVNLLFSYNYVSVIDKCIDKIGKRPCPISLDLMAINTKKKLSSSFVLEAVTITTVFFMP